MQGVAVRTICNETIKMFFQRQIKGSAIVSIPVWQSVATLISQNDFCNVWNIHFNSVPFGDLITVEFLEWINRVKYYISIFNNTCFDDIVTIYINNEASPCTIIRLGSMEYLILTKVLYSSAIWTCFVRIIIVINIINYIAFSIFDPNIHFLVI